MLPLVAILVLVAGVAHADPRRTELAVSDTAAQVPSPEDTAGAPAPPRRDPSLAASLHGALLGQTLGLAAGVLGGILLASLVPCEEDGVGATCTEETLHVVGMGATLLAPLGAATGAIAGGELAGERGTRHAPFWTAAAGWLVSFAAVIPVAALSASALATIVAAQLLGGILGPVLAAAGFDGRPVVPSVAAGPGRVHFGIAAAL